jgi:hypothetical protein
MWIDWIFKYIRFIVNNLEPLSIVAPRCRRRRQRLLSCLMMRYCVGKVFGFNHKIMLNVQESPPSITITRNLWTARAWVRDWLCKGNTHHPQCTLPKVSFIVVWLFFFSKLDFYLLIFSKVQGRSLFMRKFLPYRVKS